MQKRRWFQIHLSTAMVLMLVASGLLWAQFRPEVNEREPSLWTGAKTEVYEVDSGWPSYCSKQYVIVDGPDSEPIEIPGTVLMTSETWDKELNRSIPKGCRKIAAPKQWSFQGVAINAVVAFGILAFVAFICEWFIRRREAAREREEA